AVLGAIGNQIHSKTDIWIAGIGSGLILGVLSYIYHNSLIQIADELLLYEIPLFAMLKNYPFNVLICMSALLWFVLFTTSASDVLGFVTRMPAFLKTPMSLIVIVVLFVMIPLTAHGFSTLINLLDPIFVVLNLYVLTRLL